MCIFEYSFFDISILEWIGYLASAFVLLSLTMSSVVRLRWINMIGAILFSFYGFMIASLPVGIMNALIVIANIYNLKKLYASKDSFTAIAVKDNLDLLNHFLSYYAKDVAKFYPYFEQQEGQRGFFVLRNMVVARIFIGRIEGSRFYIDLDYALPAYRDFKVGKYLYPHLNNLLAPKQIKEVCCENEQMLEYMTKMGFETQQENGKAIMIKKM